MKLINKYFSPPARILSAACAAVTLVAAGPASARIVPGHGIAGVTLRMTQAQVHAELGPPLRITRTRGALGFLITRLHYPRLDVDLQKLAKQAVVIRVLTSKPGETTASGVGVGSPIAAVQHLHDARCWTKAGSRYCGIGNRTPLHSFTLFWIGSNGHATLIEVSLNVNS